MTARFRVGVIAIIAAVIVAAAVIDRQDQPSAKARAESAALPAASSESAGSSAWYCTGATSAPNGVADGTVVVANTGHRTLNGVVTVVPQAGDNKQVPIQVAPSGTAPVHLADVIQSPFASAVVELDGGAAGVDLVTSGAVGGSVAPCASQVSSDWYFAEGATTKDAAEALLLFNPFPDDAVVSITFSTEEGQVVPQALTGMTVRGQAMTAINVGDYAQRRAAVATAINAQRGRLVVARLQTFDGSAGRKGLSVAIGSPVLAPLWYFPEGKVGQGLTEHFQLFNPSKDEVSAQVALILDQGQAEPIVVAIPAESRTTISANDEARIPKEVSHSAIVRTDNGAVIDVERTIDAASPPASRAGLSIMAGALSTAARTVFPAGESDDNVEEWLVFVNPGTAPASVSVSLLVDGSTTPIPQFQNLDVAPGGRRAIRITDAVKRGATPALVNSTQPIVAERDLYRIKGLGTSMTIGIPLAS